MKKLLFILFLFTSSLFADSIKISADFLSMSYTETDDSGSFLDSEKNNDYNINGLELVYNLHFANGFAGGDEDLLEFSVDYTKGDTIYTGALFSTTTGEMLTPYTSTTTNTIINSKIRFSETKKTHNYDITVFTSLGYRNWERDMQGPYGYLETYEWFYGDIGMKILLHDKNWHLGFEAAYQLAFEPKMTANLNGGMTFDLGETSGYYYKIPLIYDINKNYKIECSYQYDYYNIEKSNQVNNFYEPHSETKNQIIKIGIIVQW